MATVTSRGQITLPGDVREALGLRSGSQVEFVVRDGERGPRRSLSWNMTAAMLISKPAVMPSSSARPRAADANAHSVTAGCSLRSPPFPRL